MKNKLSQSPVPKVKRDENTGLSFPDAIGQLIGGKKIRRQEWSDETEFCLLKESFLMIHRNDKFHSWIVSEGDLMAKDWVVVK